jgi:hypothetical protein
MLEVLCVEMERRDCGRSKDLAASRSCNNRTTRASNRSRAAPSSGWMSTTSCRQRRSEALLIKLAARNPMRTQRRAGVAQSGSEPRMPVVVSTPSTLAGADRARFSNVYRINAIASGSQNPRIEINTPKMIPRAAPSGSSTRVELSTRAYRRENPAAGRTSCVNVCAIVASPSWFDFRFQGSRGPHAGESGRTPFSL